MLFLQKKDSSRVCFQNGLGSRYERFYMSLSFSSFRIQDKSLFQQYVQNGGRLCEHAFANLFAWQQAFGNQWAECEDRLIVRSRINVPNESSKYMILPNVYTVQLPEILQRIQEDAAGNPFCLVQMSEEEKRYLEQHFPDTFLFDNPREAEDYVYDVEDFKTFKGRKLAAKRNHVNKFKSLYAYHYEELIPEMFSECLRLLRLWRAEQYDTSALLDAEERVIRVFFDHYRELDLSGGALFVDQDLVAFTIGSPISGQIFDIHIEKADVCYEGVFPMISQLFAQHLPSQYRYVNREEDLGLPGLRQSKLSYHPLKMEPKFSACPLDDDLRGVIRLWLDCFHDDESFIHAFLSRYYHRERVFLHREAGCVVAQCMLVPCMSEGRRIGYLYAIATAEACRGRGLAAQVTEEAIAYARNQDMDALVLIPADDRLRHYYTRFGFEAFPCPIRFTSDLDLGTGDVSKDYPMILKMKDISFPEGELVCVPEG